MNIKRNKEKMAPSPRKKARGSLEFIITAGVLIVVIAFIALYLHSASNTKIGNAKSIVAAGSSAPTELTLALSEPLPTNANNISIYVSGTAPATATGLSLPSLIYVNNYPEYVFEITASNSITVDSVTGMSYSLNGQTIHVATGTGAPLPIQPILSANVVMP